MFLRQFLTGIVAVLLIYAACLYATGSVLSSVIWTAISVVLLQVGYFLIVLLLVYRKKLHADCDTAQKNAGRHRRN